MTKGPDRINPGVFSSNRDDWSTPDDLYQALDSEFGFTLDPCADDDNHKCDRYFTEKDDGLAQSWDGTVFVNPPFTGIAKWIEKAYTESLAGATVVLLIPARTDTAYWHDYVMRASELRFIRGRLHFGGSHERTAHNAPFPSVVAVFRPGGSEGWPRVSSMNRNGTISIEDYWRQREVREAA